MHGDQRRLAEVNILSVRGARTQIVPHRVYGIDIQNLNVK